MAQSAAKPPLDAAIERLEAMHQRSGYSEVQKALDELYTVRRTVARAPVFVQDPVSLLVYTLMDRGMVTPSQMASAVAAVADGVTPDDEATERTAHELCRILPWYGGSG